MEKTQLDNYKKNGIEVSIVIVSYNDKIFLLKCLSSIYSYIKELAFEVIVVENNSTDGTDKILREKFPQVTLIKCSKNIGFAKGNNLAVSKCCGKYILLLNSDTVVLESGIMDLVNFAHLHPDAGVIGGKTLNLDGSVQYTCRRFPGFWVYFLAHTIELVKHFNNPILDKFNMVNFNHKYSQEVDWVTGCYMLIPREVIVCNGLFDENIFMYWEDLELCFRLHNNGYKIYYASTSPIIHFVGTRIRKNNLGYTLFSFNSSKWLLMKSKNRVISKIFEISVLSVWFIFFILFGTLKYICKSKNILSKYKLFRELIKNFYKKSSEIESV